MFTGVASHHKKAPSSQAHNHQAPMQKSSFARGLSINFALFCVISLALLKAVLIQHSLYGLVENNVFRPPTPSSIEANGTTLDVGLSLDWSSVNGTSQFQPSLSSPSLLPACTRDQVINGNWNATTLNAPPYVPRNVQIRCYPESEYKKGYWSTYEWQPASTNCELSSWNKNVFCTLLRRSTVLIIGDSLSWEHYRSLNHLLGTKDLSQSMQHESKEMEKNIVKLACQRQVRLVFRRDDLLSHVTDAIFTKGTFPQVIVLNRGAHYQNDTKLMEGVTKVIVELKVWQSKCNEYGIKCHLFWRTSVPGHPHCYDRNYTEPVNDLGSIESLIGDLSNYDNRTVNYHWYDYQHQNELVVNMLTQTFGPSEVEIIDGYYLNVRRPDEHRAHQGDCLHSCYPGKMDVYSQLLLHYLKAQRSQDDIAALIAWQDTYFTNQTASSTSPDNNITRSVP